MKPKINNYAKREKLTRAKNIVYVRNDSVIK